MVGPIFFLLGCSAVHFNQFFFCSHMYNVCQVSWFSSRIQQKRKNLKLYRFRVKTELNFWIFGFCKKKIVSLSKADNFYTLYTIFIQFDHSNKMLIHQTLLVFQNRVPDSYLLFLYWNGCFVDIIFSNTMLFTPQSPLWYIIYQREILLNFHN